MIEGSYFGKAMRNKKNLCFFYATPPAANEDVFVGNKEFSLMENLMRPLHTVLHTVRKCLIIDHHVHEELLKMYLASYMHASKF